MSLGSAIIAAGEPNNPSIQNHIDVKILGEIDSDLEEEIWVDFSVETAEETEEEMEEEDQVPEIRILEEIMKKR